MKKAASEDMLYIPEQFDKASDFGYLRRHAELTDKLMGLFERHDANRQAGHVESLQERHKDDLFHQACEDVARAILLSEEAITSIPVSDAQSMVESRYSQFLENPETAAYSRSLAVH